MVGIKDERLEGKIKQPSEHITANKDYQSDKIVMAEVAAYDNGYSKRNDTDSQTYSRPNKILFLNRCVHIIHIHLRLLLNFSSLHLQK